MTTSHSKLPGSLREFRRLLVVALAAAGTCLAALALASPGESDARAILTALKTGVSSDGGVVTSSATAPSAIASAGFAVTEAERFLARADTLRKAGDLKHAEIADQVALEWAETARDLVVAADLDAEAAKDTVAAGEAASKAEKARRLLDVAITRRAKAATALELVEKEMTARALDGGPPVKLPGGKKPKGKGAK